MPVHKTSKRNTRVARIDPKHAPSVAQSVLPPGTVVRLENFDGNTPEWADEIGREFRVGYYNSRDGLSCIWLVNESGKYEQTTDLPTLLRHFTVRKLTKTTDYFGQSSAPLRALPPARATSR